MLRISSIIDEHLRGQPPGNTTGPPPSQRSKVSRPINLPGVQQEKANTLYQGHLASEPRTDSKEQQDDNRRQL